MEKELKKPSKEWDKGSNYIVLDPDGWDRKNFDYSWNKELITLQEFRRRVSLSTCKKK